MSNKIGSLEEIGNRDFSYSEIESLDITGLKTVYTVDFLNKRRVKTSIPTLILSEIENKSLTPKEIENSLFRKNNKALRIVKEKYPDFRAYLKRRITAVFRYYLNNSVIEEIGGRAVIRELKDGKEYYSLSLRLIPNKE